MNLVAVLSRYIQSQVSNSHQYKYRFLHLQVFYLSNKNVVYPLLVINLLGIGLNILLHQTFMVWMNMGLMYNFVDLTKIIVNIYNMRKLLQIIEALRYR